jgi:hypothetical protein
MDDVPRIYKPRVDIKRNSVMSNRQQSGTRHPACLPGTIETRPSGLKVSSSFKRMLLFGSLLLSALVVVRLVLTVGARLRPSAMPFLVSQPKHRSSNWINLPKPVIMGHVPDTWNALKLGMQKEDLDLKHLFSYDEDDQWADAVFVPDLSHSDAFFGLSFYQNRLYKIAVRIGEESSIPASSYAATGPVAYGQARSYDYLLSGSSHTVLVFQPADGSRVLKLDAVRRKDDLFLIEVVLMDRDVAAARESAKTHRSR